MTASVIDRSQLDNNTSDYGRFRCRHQGGVADSESTPVEIGTAVSAVDTSFVAETGNPRCETGSPDP